VALIFVSSFYALLMLLPCLVIACTSRRIALSSNSSSIIDERQALIQSGWWNDYRNISNHCHWNGIYCNEDGSVTEILPSSWKINASEESGRIQNLILLPFPISQKK
jgi:hypothetical protein